MPAFPQIAVIVFVAVVLAVLLPYWFLVVRDEQRVLGRLTPRTSRTRTKRLKVLKPEDAQNSVGTLNTVLQNTAFAVRIRLLLEQSAVKMNVGVFVLASGAAAFVVFLFMSVLTRQPLVGLGFSLLGLFIPYLYVKRALRKRVDKFEEQFPEAIELVARALRAGHALPTGLGMVADELKAPVGTEFRILYDEQNFGLTLPDAMRNFARRVPVLDARFFVTAVLTQRETGGNLAEVLDNLGAVIRDRFKIKRQVRVLSAHGRITGWVLAGLPPALAIVTLVVNPQHLGTLLTDPLGHQMLIVAGVLQVLGTAAISKMVKVEVLMTAETALALVIVFAAVGVTVALVLSRVLSEVTPERRRLRQTERVPVTGVLLEAPILTPDETAFVKRMSAVVPRSPKDMSSLRRRFARAGYHTLTPIANYTLACLVLPVVFGVLPLAFSPAANIAWVLVLIGAAVGYQLPSLWLMRKTTTRQKEIQNGLPDLLDLLIVCLEAGSGLDQAIVKSSDELEIAYPALAEEFRLLVTEVRAGKPRLEAFRNLASRTGVEDVRSLVAMLVQTDRFGTSVAQALRTHAEVARTKRRQRAEERAAKMGVKLVFPLVFMLFPAFFVVTLGPAVIQFVRVFFGQVIGR